MIETLNIQNYRLFDDLKIEKLGQVNLITGKNNTGKTALLEALRIFANNMNVNIMGNIIHLRKEYDESKKNESFATLFGSFKKHTQGQDYSFRINDKGWGMTIRKDGFAKVHRGDANISMGQIVGIDSFNYKNPPDEVVYVPFSSDHEFKILTNFWEKIEFNEVEKQQIVDVLNIISLKKIKLFSLSSGSPRVQLENGQVERLTSWGDGANRLLMIGLALANAKGKMLLIDEFEVGLHHSVQENLWDIIFE
jgi:AAA15 family ATPase/GTPase